MSGMSTALVNGAAGGLSQGVTTGDWKDSMVDSMRNSAASYLGGNLGGGNDALTNASSMLFRKMLGSKEDFSWDTVAKNDAIGKLVGDYLNDMLMSDQQRQARATDEQKRQQEQGKTAQGLKLMNMFENTIGGFFSRLGDDMNALAADVGNAAAGVKSAWGSIKNGEAWENIKAGAATAWEGVKGAASWVKDKAVSAWNGVKNVASSAWNSVAGAVSTAVGAVKDFGQSVKNKVIWGVYGTNDDLEVQRAIAYQTPVRSDMPPGVRGSLEDVEGLVGYTGDKPIGTGFMEESTVESRFKKGTNMLNYTRKLSAYYSSEDNPISQEKAMQRLCEANGGITPAELQEKVNRGEPINEPADMSWNKDVQKMYVSKPITASEMSNAEYMQRFREMDEKLNNSGRNNRGERINQYELGLPGQKKACTLLATYTAVSIVSDNELNSIHETYEKSKDKAIDNSKNTMYVKSYNGVSKNAGATDVVVDERGTWIDKNTGNVDTDKVVDNATAIKNMKRVLDNNGAIIARFNGHSAVFNGYTVQNEKLVFTVVDSGLNNNTFYDPDRRQMFTYDNNRTVYDKAWGKNRYLQNYRAVRKK